MSNSLNEVFAQGSSEPNDNTDVNLGFFPNVPPRTPSASAATNPSVAMSVGEAGGRVLDILDTALDGDLEGVKEKGAQLATDTIVDLTKQAVRKGGEALINTVTKNQSSRSGGRSTKRGVDEPTGGGGDRFREPEEGGFSSGRHHPSLDQGQPPTPARLNTDIDPNCYGSYRFEADEGKALPLHLTLANFTLPGLADATNNPASRFLWYTVLDKVLQAVQASISFNLPTGFTAADFYSAMQDLIFALEVYWFGRTIIQYKSNKSNTNEGIEYLRDSLTATYLTDLAYLGDALQGLTIPPNLLQMVFYFYQIYQSSDLPGSSLVMICPIPFKTGSSPYLPDWSYINIAYTNLKRNNNKIIWDILAKSCPNWKVESLPQPGITAYYDRQFLTIWSNLPYSATSTVAGSSYQYIGPSATTVYDDIKYYSYTNQLDGAAYAMTSVYVTSLGKFIPGMFVPLTTTTATNVNSNRLSFAEIGGVKNFYDTIATSNYTIAVNRGDTYAINNLVTDSNHNFGTETVYGVNSRSISQTASKFIDLLFETKSIYPRVDKRFNSGKGGRK